MKIKLDENLPFSLATVLDELGHDVHTTREEGLSGHADREIWQSAQRESRFLITRIWTSLILESLLQDRIAASYSSVFARQVGRP
jgi:Domain of unknown function (DUF5615)